MAALLLAIPVALWPFGVWTGVLAALAALAFICGLDWLSAPRAGDLQASLDCPGVVTSGRSAVVTVSLHNLTRRSLKASVHIQALPSLGLIPGRQSVRLAAGEWGKAESGLTPRARGRFVAGPVTIRTSGIWGLAGRQSTLPLHSKLKVYPALAGRRQIQLRFSRARLLQSGERSAAMAGGGTEFDSLREYHPDDEFRRINWRATARATRPISNTFREERNQRVFVMVDAGRSMASSIEGFTRLEYAIDTCAAVAELAGRIGDHVGMIAFGRDVLEMVGPKSGKAQGGRILDRLFDLRPSLGASNYGYAFGWLLSRFPRRALLVVLTEINDVAAIESFLAAMPMLASRHLVIVGSIIDPAVEGLARSVPVSSEQAYLKASAEAALLARHEAARRLRSMGATVVDRRPGELAGRVADEYLRIKAFGRL